MGAGGSSPPGRWGGSWEKRHWLARGWEGGERSPCLPLEGDGDAEKPREKGWEGYVEVKRWDVCV